MIPKHLLLVGALWPLAPLAATPVLNADFDSMAPGATDDAALNAATTGGTWSLNVARDANGCSIVDSPTPGDKALLLDDDNGGNAGEIPFATLTLDAPADISSSSLAWTLRSATRRTGSNKGLSYRFYSGTTLAARIDWWNSGALWLQGGTGGSVPFAFTFIWDPAATSVYDVSVTFAGTDVTVDFGGQVLTGAVLDGVTSIDKLEVLSLGSEGAGARGVFLDDLTVDSVPSTAPPTIDSLTVSPGTILDDRMVTLTWTTSNATSVSIDQGIASTAPDGSEAVLVPAASLPLTFTLTATNANATPPDDTATAQVTVTARPGVTETPVLMAHWPFDGDLTESVVGWTTTKVDGGDTFDDIGFAADVPAALAGRRTQSLHFTDLNADDHIATAFAGVPGTSPRSISYWIRSSDTTSLCPFSYGLDNQGRALVNRIDPDGTMRFGFRGATEIVTPPGAVPAASWTHIALVFAGFSGDAYENATIYIDGVRYNQTGFVGAFDVSTVQRPLLIGRDTTRPADPALLQDVWLSELTFYRGELTTAQVQALAGGTDPVQLDGSPTPSIQAVPLVLGSTAPLPPGATTLPLTYSATQGAALELWTTTDLETDWTLLNANVFGTGAPASLTPAIDPATEPRRFFQLRQK